MSWVMDQAHSSVEFAVKHMMISTVRGRFSKFEIDLRPDEENPERSQVEARVEASSIDTKEPQRDTHLRSPDFLDVEKYPWITFKSRRVEYERGSVEFKLAGDLTIRDVTREVVLTATYSGTLKDPWGNERAGFTAETAINRKDFGLVWNVALEAGGVLVGDTIKIYIEAEFVKQG